MAYPDLIDNFQTTLAAGYVAGGVALQLTSGAGLPAGACDFYLLVKAEGANTTEIFHVTNVAGVNLTVVGAQANTIASNHAIAAVVICGIIVVAQQKQLMRPQSQLVTGRAANVVIHNTGIGPTFHVADISVVAGGSPADAHFATDSANPPVTSVCGGYHANGESFSLFAICLPGNFIELVANPAFFTLNYWIEWS